MLLEKLHKEFESQFYSPSKKQLGAFIRGGEKQINKIFFRVVRIKCKNENTVKIGMNLNPFHNISLISDSKKILQSEN